MVSYKKQNQASFIEDSFIYDFSSIKEYGITKKIFSNLHLIYWQQIKHDYFWILRLGLKKMIQQILPLLSQLINSSINIFLKLTEKYDSSEFLYFLAEDIPTYSIHRLLFSGYMKKY